MFRIQARRLGSSGPLCATKMQMLWWGYKEQDLHRLARKRPWWENAAIFTGLLCFIQVTSVCYYFGNRLYHSLRPSGNNLYINNALDMKVFSRPDLSVAAVRMVVHHALSGAQTPFGTPMVYPEYMRPEAEELMEFIFHLHREQPMFSIPDLWAMLSAKALSRLGGPNITVRRGRPHPPCDLTTDQLLVTTPSLVSEIRRDVLSLKRLLAAQGFSVEEIVGMIGGIRTIGFHEGSAFHTKEEVKPQMRRRPSLMGPEADMFHLPDMIEKCTLDPYVFGGEYFDLLLDYNWKQRSVFRRRQGDLFQCEERDRKREVVLLDPFSEQAFLKERKRLQAREKAREAVERASKKRDLLAAGEDGGSVTQRDGEAQYIPGVEMQNDVDNDVTDTEGGGLVVPEFKSPCPSVSMREIDMQLLDDALLTGWMHRFSSNEIRFYTVFGEVVEKIQSRGYNPNSLYISA